MSSVRIVFRTFAAVLSFERVKVSDSYVVNRKHSDCFQLECASITRNTYFTVYYYDDA